MTDQPGFGVDEIDRLARRAVDMVLTLVRRGMALAGGVLMIAAFCCILGFLLGLAALSDGVRTVWIVLGGFFMVVGIGAVIVAMFRLRTVRRGADALLGEVRQLIAGDRQTERVVIETLESTEGNETDGVVVLSRQFYGMQGAVGGRREQFAAVTEALRAITTFPLLIALSSVISFVFAGLGLIFLIALAL